MRAADGMHDGLSNAQIYGKTTRNGIAPHLVDGFALAVRAPGLSSNLFDSVQW